MAKAKLDMPRVWIKPYYPSFNGLRGVAVLMVFLYHYSGYLKSRLWQRVGWVGVDLFFVLSGFLITGILYDSLRDSNYFRNFYVRRALRIFPIFYGFFFLLFVLTPIVHLRYTWRLLSFFFYFGNLVVPFADLVHHNPTIISMIHDGRMVAVANIGHLWSLCVEEQFYLIWPAVVWAVQDRRRLMNVCVAVSAGTLLGRCLLIEYANPQHIAQYLLHWSLYTRCDTLLVGAWIALWLRGSMLTTCRLHQISRYLFLPSAVVLAIGMELAPHWLHTDSGTFLGSFGYTLIAFCAAGVLLLSLDEKSWLSRVLQLRGFRELGVISYGFYFLHDLLRDSWIYIAKNHPDISFDIPFIDFGLTVLIAWLSFRYYESRFLKLKELLAPGHRSVPSGREQVEFIEPAS